MHRSLATLVLCLALPASAAAQTAIIKTSRSNIKQIVLQLDGASDSTDVLAVEGGQPVADIMLVNVAPFQRVRQVGKPKFEDITLTVSANIGASLAAWIQETLSGKVGRTRSGHVIVFDDRGRVAHAVTFHEALITEIGLPALDGASKESAGVTISVAPTSVETKSAFPAGTGFQAPAGKAKQ